MYSYERLETLGDSVLKMITSLFLFSEFEELTEGQLSSIRTSMVCNGTLNRIIAKTGLHTFIQGVFSLSKSFVPPGRPSKIQLRALGGKPVADLYESLLGVIYLNNGLQKAAEFLVSTGVINHIPLSPQEIQIGQMSDDDWNKVDFDFAVEKIIGYEFKNKELLLSAFTHSSFSAKWPNYQRLEWFGDAIIDFFVTKRLYEKFPEAVPGQLSILRASSVNNEVLSFILVGHKLEKYILHRSKNLKNSIESFRDITLRGAVFTGFDMLPFEPPKVLGDVYEALVGAIALDGGFSAAMNINDQMMKGFLDNIQSSTHPLIRLQEMLVKMMGLNLSTSVKHKKKKKCRVCICHVGHRILSTGVARTEPAAKRLAALEALQSFDWENELAMELEEKKLNVDELTEMSKHDKPSHISEDFLVKMRKNLLDKIDKFLPRVKELMEQYSEANTPEISSDVKDNHAKYLEKETAVKVQTKFGILIRIAKRKLLRI
eukprot:TRINITY_DN125_c0_g3_i2.p1 TRINITY_DN125_c0_g3~~TRINITY_DN125_c0_g3_i2.p1  ORF type:complete len:524 (+),score=76.88 TRINITY_DN125_c0_g3_i2:113-1573(+)